MQQILNTSPSAVLLLNFDNEIAYANPKAVKWFQLGENYQGKKPRDIEHPIFKKIENVALYSSEIIQTDGSKQYKIERAQFVDRGFNRQFILIEDISQEIIAAEKRAYEKVIRMMAHEVNNSIGAINSIIGSTIEYQEDLVDPFAKEMSNALRVAKDRNDRLNLFMRNFADIIRLPLPKKEVILVQLFAEDVAELMRPFAAKNNISIELKTEESPLKVAMDIRQIEQVLVNIIKNAVEAIDKNGIIQIELKSESKCLIIKDNGKGLTDEQAAQIFTPFYSDKAHGQGIGLTLSREILLNHGFEFSLRTVGEWTRFEIKF